MEHTERHRGRADETRRVAAPKPLKHDGIRQFYCPKCRVTFRISRRQIVKEACGQCGMLMSSAGRVSYLERYAAPSVRVEDLPDWVGLHKPG